MKLQFVFQKRCRLSGIPDKLQFQSWVDAALHANALTATSAELCLRVVNEKEGTYLNETFRQKKGPTNVLSFPQDAEENTEDHLLLGDLALCAPLITAEAKAQEKDLLLHWAHLTVHGTLHLLGYDHEVPAEAAVMEQQEIVILKQLGFGNPYE